MYTAFNKAFFPSGNINIENIIKDAMPKPEEIKKDTKNELIVTPTDSVVDLPIPQPENDTKNISRKEKRYLDRKEKKQLEKQQNKKTLKNTEKINRENMLNKLKNETKTESIKQSFNEEDLKRIERILFQK